MQRHIWPKASIVLRKTQRALIGDRRDSLRGDRRIIPYNAALLVADGANYVAFCRERWAGEGPAVAFADFRHAFACDQDRWALPGSDRPL